MVIRRSVAMALGWKQMRFIVAVRCAINDE